MAGAFGERLQRASLIPRVLTAVIGIPLVFLTLWAGGLWWVGLTAGLALIGWMEFVRLHALGLGLRGLVLALLIALFAIMTWGDDVLVRLLFLFWILMALSAGIIPYFWRARMLAMLRARSSDPNQDLLFWRLNASVLGPFYLAVPTALLARWRLEFSAWSVLAFLLVIWANDTAAYFIGLATGRRKLAPSISPGKSWEGAVAGAVVGALVGALAAVLLDIRPGLALLFGFFITIASQLGDLFESAMKRRAGLKDSGTLLPGHGGILDRFDGILVAAPIAYMLIRMWAGPR